MKRALFLSALMAVPAISIFACSGAVLPVAQDNGDSGTSGSSGASGSSSTSSGASGSTSSGSTSSGGSTSGSTGSTSSSSGSSGGNCPADAGGNNCLCGDLICQGGQWVCGPCNDAGVDTCTPACKSSELCVRDQIVGGAILFPDAGVCPDGTHLNGNYCERNPTFMCVLNTLPCAGATLTCACASSLCTSQSSCGYKCESTTQDQVNCLCQVP